MSSAPPDFYLDWNSDFIITPSGSVQTAVGWDQVRQRIIRRMITSAAQELPDGTFTPPGYLFHPDYGNGLGQMVGQGFSAEALDALERRISLSVLQDDAVDSSVPPSIQFLRPDVNTLWIVVAVQLASGQPGQIALKVS